MNIEDSGRGETKDLFVGNLVDEDATTAHLKLLLNTAMQKLGLVGQNESPVVSSRMSNKYCFIEFRSINDASKCINLTGIPFKGYPLKMGRPAKFQGPVNSIYTWAELLPYMKKQHTNSAVSSQSSITNTSKLPIPSTKIYREIFVGNTNSDMSEDLLRDLIGSAMIKMGLSHSKLENPVYQVKLTGKFAFLEMRTCIDAANVLNLNGLPCCGNALNITRTKKYDGGCGIEAYFLWDTLYQLYVDTDLRLMTAGKPTKILCISNITTIEALTSDPNLYLDIIEDIRIECNTIGNIKSVIVPRTISSTGNNNSIGRVFIEMDNIQQSIDVLILLKGRNYDNRIVDIKFYSEEAFYSMNYSQDPDPIIITASYGATTKERVFTPTALHKMEVEKDL